VPATAVSNKPESFWLDKHDATVAAVLLNWS